MDGQRVSLSPTALQAPGLWETAQATVGLGRNPVGTRICWSTQLSLCTDIRDHSATWDSPPPEAFQGLYSSCIGGFSQPSVMANFAGKSPQIVDLRLACGDPAGLGAC